MQDTILRLTSYGNVIKLDKANARDVVSKKWGFEFYTFPGGCLYEKEEKDSIDIQNKIVDSKLLQKFGNNWITKFEKEVDTEDSIEQIAIHLIDTIPLVVKCKKQASNENKLYYKLTPEGESKYKISGRYADYSKRVEEYQCFLIAIDYKSREFIIESDKVERTYPKNDRVPNR